MRRAHSFLATILSMGAAGVLLAACSGDRPALPTAPDPPEPSSADARWVRPPSCAPITMVQVARIFEPRTRGAVVLALVLLQLEVRTGHMDRARDLMYRLWSRTLDAYYDGQLIGDMSPDTRQRLIDFGTKLHCMVGLDGSALGGDLDPLGPSDVVRVVFPSPNDQTVMTGDGQGGIRIPSNTLTAPATIEIIRITSSFGQFEGPLNTRLDQYGPYFQVRVVPEQSFSREVLVGFCMDLPDAGNLPPRVHLAHNVGSGIEILPREVPDFLSCGGGHASTSVRQLIRGHEYARAALRAAQAGLEALGPAPLHALSLGIGGRTSTFSPFGGVDTLVEVVAASPIGQPGSPGAPVASPPSVLMRTIGAHTPLAGGVVTFAVTTGGGGLTGPTNSSIVSTLVLPTTSDGVASVWSWILGTGAGTNTVNAAGAYSVIPGVTVRGPAITFSATAGTPTPSP